MGGNDVLSYIGILNERINSSAEVFSQVADLSKQFEQRYEKLLQKILSLSLPTTICTIYNPRFSEKFYQKITVAALMVFNDVIIRQGFQFGVPLIDLRVTCNQEQDYANTIEPSALGGGKISNAIMNIVLEYDFQRPYTQVFY